ncbi:MAG: S66 family peptidase [Bacillota bacterium]
MLQLIKPDRLRKGDKVATVSLSWGGAGDKEILWRYRVGKQRLQELGLHIVEMENTLKGTEYIYNNPEKRAKDLMDAFMDPEIKGIFSCIGGDDSIRLLPYIDYDVIIRNPKIFLGYSDSTVTHLICLKAGIQSYYGPSILAEFGENIKVFEYTMDHVDRALFTEEPIGLIEPAEWWTGERIEWLEENKDKEKTMCRNEGYDFIQGSGIVEGQLIGGCMDVLEMAKATEIWPDREKFNGSILFFETSEETVNPKDFVCWLRNYGAQGILQDASAIIFGKPYQGKYYKEYRDSIKKVGREYNLNMPIVFNMSFGHNEPMCILPYGAMARIDCEKKIFSIID